MRVCISYRTYRTSGTGNTRENTPGMVLYVPYRTRPWKDRKGYQSSHRGIQYHREASRSQRGIKDHREASKITERHQRSQRHQRSKRGFTNQYWNRGITGQRGTIVSQILEGHQGITYHRRISNSIRREVSNSIEGYHTSLRGVTHNGGVSQGGITGA